LFCSWEDRLGLFNVLWLLKVCKGEELTKAHNANRSVCYIFDLDISEYYMYICSMISKDLLKGTLKTIVLKLLEEKGRMYGYEITQEVERLTEGKVQLSWGALYPALHKLEADKLITSEEESIGKRVRKYYRLTESGTSAAKEKIREFIDFVTIMGRVLDTGPSLNLA